MVDKKKIVGEKDFISYLDDDGTKKDQYVIIQNKTEYGIYFKFEESDTQIIFMPMHRVFKTKEVGK